MAATGPLLPRRQPRRMASSPERLDSRAGSLRPTARERAAGFRRCRSPCAALRLRPLSTAALGVPSCAHCPLAAAPPSARHPDTPAVAC